jgi:hypothetical protein
MSFDVDGSLTQDILWLFSAKAKFIRLAIARKAAK